MPKPEKAYPVRLAGTRGYQGAITFATIGDAAVVLRELGNPYDPDALAVVDADGETLGYLPRDSWLRGALLDDGRGCRSVIDTLSAGADGITGVTISVTLTDDAIGERTFARAD